MRRFARDAGLGRGERQMAIPEEFQTRIDEIRKDRAGGAARLAVRAAAMLVQCAQSAPEHVPEVARGLAAAQPAMGPICNLVRRTLAASDVAAACHEFLEAMERGSSEVATRAAALIKDGAAVMTHSFSSTVLAACREAHQEGKRFSVVCTESRPVCEGIALAASLGMAGINASVIADAAMHRTLPEVQLVWVGADAISPRGVFNKTGTALMALAAHQLKVPVYVLCGSDKFLPASYEPPPEEPRDPHEILDRDLPLVTAVNYYFDLTPLDYITHVVAEDRLYTAAELRKKLKSL
jgi:translation initiation factor 2B subunit (eIF-2B alpha/beta/delta family)